MLRYPKQQPPIIFSILTSLEAGVIQTRRTCVVLRLFFSSSPSLPPLFPLAFTSPGVSPIIVSIVGMGTSYFRFSPMCSASLPPPLSPSSHSLGRALPCLLPPWPLPYSSSSLSAASYVVFSQLCFAPSSYPRPSYSSRQRSFLHWHQWGST